MDIQAALALLTGPSHPRVRFFAADGSRRKLDQLEAVQMLSLPGRYKICGTDLAVRRIKQLEIFDPVREVKVAKHMPEWQNGMPVLQPSIDWTRSNYGVPATYTEMVLSGA